MAVAAQFLYVAAQAGIFSFFINYMTLEVPPFRFAECRHDETRRQLAGVHPGMVERLVETRTVLGADDVKDCLRCSRS